MPKRQIICGLDIGSTKVCACIGTPKRDSQDIDIIGLGYSHLKAIDEFDMDIYTTAIDEAVSTAENMANEKVLKAWVNVTSGNIKSAIQKSTLTISDKADEVARNDVERLIKNAKEITLSLDREIIHAIPLGWTLDGQDGIIRNPVGLYGTILGLELHIISALASYLHNVRKCVHLSGIEIEQMACSSIATGIAVLSEQERQDGVILIDIGGKKTDICLFANGLPRGIEQFDFGGDWLTSAISKGLKVTHRHAEAQKLNYTASKDLHLKKVINDEQAKMFKFIYSRICQKEWEQQAFSGTVITGKSAFLDNLIELAGNVLNMPVRIGVVPTSYFNNLPCPPDSPVLYATSVGLLKYASMQSELPDIQSVKASVNRKGFLKRFCLRAREVWQEYF